MELKEVVRFIYEHALSVVEPWNDGVLEKISALQLSNNGFRVESPFGFWVGMREFQDTIFVDVHAPNVSYTSMAHDQKRARAMYDKIVDTLLAT